MFPSALGRADHGSVLPQTDRSVNRGRHPKAHPGSGARKSRRVPAVPTIPMHGHHGAAAHPPAP